MPVNGEKGHTIGFGMRKDICEALDIDYENFQSMEDLHDALVKVKEAYPDMDPVVSNGGDMYGSSIVYLGQDDCGDTFNLAVLEDPFDENGQIVSFFETDLFRESCERMYQWCQEGLVMKDASFNTDSAMTLVSAGNAFGYFQQMAPSWKQPKIAVWKWCHGNTGCLHIQETHWRGLSRLHQGILRERWLFMILCTVIRLLPIL